MQLYSFRISYNFSLSYSNFLFKPKKSLKFLSVLIINIPPYVELNNLAIIEEIGVIKENNQYTLILKEVIPIKDNQGIKYQYKYYQESSTTLINAYENLKEDTKKKLYLKKAKSLITNISSSKEILEILNIKPGNIIHTKDNIFKKIKSN